VVELHGSIRSFKCLTGRHAGFTRADFAGQAEVPPRCPHCGDLLRPDVVWFGELLPAAEPVYACGADETLLGIVPFVTNRRVVTVLPGDLDLSSRAAPPLFVVVQSKTAEQPCPGIERLYYVVEGRSFGPGRRISLWRLKAK
jgi:hypothetical protein